MGGALTLLIVLRALLACVYAYSCSSCAATSTYTGLCNKTLTFALSSGDLNCREILYRVVMCAKVNEKKEIEMECDLCWSAIVIILLTLCFENFTAQALHRSI